MDAEEARTIGWALWRVRDGRGKSLRVVAGLAGMSKDTLNRIERGLLSPTLNQIHALAEALQISVSELTRLPVPAPANGQTDSAITAVFLALMAASRNRPGGQVLPVGVLRVRVEATQGAHYSCSRDHEVGAELPVLIRDLHTSIAVGREVAQLLDLAVVLHAGATTGWLRVAGAPIETRVLAAALALRAADDRDTPEARGLALWGGLHVMVAAGAVDLARTELAAVSVATSSSESMQLAGMLALSHSFIAAVDSRPGDLDAPLEYATELAVRTGEGNAYWMGFGPTNVGFWRLHTALEAGDHQLAVAVAEGLRPEAHPFRGCQAMYWVDYGRALARLRGRHDDAVMALRRAELISPRRVLRDPITRDVLAVLLRNSRRGSPADQELRGMARRAGLSG
ncbi:MAG: helix-turn-helix domain-containing protein [Pseudonocardiaceae bacterium]